VSRWADKYVIGLTGNIAVGKSVVRQMLQHLGAYTIDADSLAHQAMSPGAPAYKPIVDTFGQFILDSEKRINRSMLASMVFSNPVALAKLESITHPVVDLAINTLIKRSKQRVIVIEAIKLLETDLAQAVDTVWVVDAKPPTQLKRLMEKRKMSEADAKQRITSQAPQADKLKKANFVVNNDGNVDETWKQVQRGWNEIRKLLEPKPAPPAPKPAPEPGTPSKATTPAPAPAPKPAPEPVAVADDTGEVPVVPPPPPESGIKTRRGMPGNAAELAEFVSRVAGKELSRMDMMLLFGQKSYHIAQTEDETIVAIAGWQVENLITRVDELYFDTDLPKEAIIQALLNAIEDASKALQSEVGFVFLPADADSETLESFKRHGYEQIRISDIKIPAWREAVQEVLSDDQQILTKQLRKNRVLQPI
jgi:dephospho-CoA kinase